MLTSNITRRLDVPGEDGAWVQIRKLPWRKLREASDAQKEQAYAHVKALGKEGMDAVSQVTPDQIAALKRDPSNQYDTGTLLRAGVTAWSYSEKPTPDEIDDLDAATSSWLVGAILALAGVTASEDDSKNG